MSGVADLRAVIARAREWIDRGGRPTVLFVDEIHRFNKAQQDALLPQVEDGTITLIGATTENPYFEVNSALLSRLRVFRLEPLTDEELGALVDRALADERGLRRRVALAGRAREHLVAISAGTRGPRSTCWRRPRAWPASTTRTWRVPRRRPTLEEIEAAAQQRILAYDRAGDGHYGTVAHSSRACAATMSTRRSTGSRPWWRQGRTPGSSRAASSSAPARMSAMPIRARSRWRSRRLQALELVGLPEAQYALAQAAAYVATAPKSNRVGHGLLRRDGGRRGHGSQPVPPHLLPASHRG